VKEHEPVTPLFCRSQAFLLHALLLEPKRCPMKTEEIKVAASALNELTESYGDMLNTMNGTVKELKTTKKLWKSGNESRLIKLGLALIVFPEPTPISETVGACFVAAGMIQKGVRNRAIYIEDVGKTFQRVFKEMVKVNFVP
jgi:hypothetical protein